MFYFKLVYPCAETYTEKKKKQNIGDNCIYKESLFCSDLEYFLWEILAFKVK